MAWDEKDDQALEAKYLPELKELQDKAGNLTEDERICLQFVMNELEGVRERRQYRRTQQVVGSGAEILFWLFFMFVLPMLLGLFLASLR